MLRTVHRDCQDMRREGSRTPYTDTMGKQARIELLSICRLGYVYQKMRTSTPSTAWLCHPLFYLAVVLHALYGFEAYSKMQSQMTIMNDHPRITRHGRCFPRNRIWHEQLSFVHINLHRVLSHCIRPLHCSPFKRRGQQSNVLVSRSVEEQINNCLKFGREVQGEW